jgi:hypothetical protein
MINATRMKFKTIKKHINIEASAEKVWEVLFTPASYEIWATVFSEGARVETNWEEGSKVVFINSAHSGLVGTIERNINSEFLSIVYTGIIKNDIEDAESEKAKHVKNARDSYSLSFKDEKTHLAIESDVEKKYFGLKTEAWKKALIIIKDLSETK